MRFNMAYQYECSYQKSWSEKQSECGFNVMCSEDKRKPGMRKHINMVF